MNPRLRQLVPDMSHFWKEILTICLATDTDNSVAGNQALMSSIGRDKARVSLLAAVAFALSITPIYTPARLTPIMAAANKYYQIYKQNPDRVNSILAHGVTAPRVSHS